MITKGRPQTPALYLSHRLRLALAQPALDACAPLAVGAGLPWMALEVAHIAEFITLRDEQLYAHVTHHGLLTYVWAKKKVGGRKRQVNMAGGAAEAAEAQPASPPASPGAAASPPLRPAEPLQLFMQAFNDTASLVASSVLGVASLARRAALVSLWVQVAAALRAHRNFNGVQAILAGLSNAAVHRLKATRARLDKGVAAEWTALSALMSHDRSYRRYRDALRRLTESTPPLPFVPYMGVHLTDLTFIGDGNPDALPASRETPQVNLSKRERVHATLSLCLAGRCVRYGFAALPGVAELLDSATRIGDDALYALSLLREPRGLSVEALERRELGPDAEPLTWTEWFLSWFGAASWPQAEPQQPVEPAAPASAAPEAACGDGTPAAPRVQNP
jgi:hypothetical protein